MVCNELPSANEQVVSTRRLQLAVMGGMEETTEAAKRVVESVTMRRWSGYAVKSSSFRCTPRQNTVATSRDLASLLSVDLVELAREPVFCLRGMQYLSLESG